jgi:hypothetical protein
MAQFTYYPDKVFLEQLNKLADEKLAERVLKAGEARWCLTLNPAYVQQ